MSDPWQEEAEVEDDWEEELAAPVGGNGLFDSDEDDELADEAEPDLWADDADDEDDAA